MWNHICFSTWTWYKISLSGTLRTLFQSLILLPLLIFFLRNIIDYNWFQRKQPDFPPYIDSRTSNRYSCSLVCDHSVLNSSDLALISVGSLCNVMWYYIPLCYLILCISFKCQCFLCLLGGNFLTKSWKYLICSSISSVLYWISKHAFI